MFAAYKKNAAKRKAAREATNARFRNRMAEIKEKEALDKLSAEAAKLAIDEKFKADIAANNAEFKEAWSK